MRSQQFRSGRVGAISRLIKIDKRVVFEVEAWDSDRKIGDGFHRRGIVIMRESRSGSE